ncbi:UNKNOWN [Stylonychia lemnae]|uniref:HTH cro/C1-type domain-containing protein n=1 Tax=Stylonychia lemnae TaxID=5949 RepID=A0A077ZXK2_STYLE|nr:UNKNOWN [Stylonychia lemnae]|eukprot:CDW73276.1 UNKNOWN [Stylonychia lemnae]
MEWNEVKAKPKKQKKAQNNDNDGFYGGQKGGHLRAGPVRQENHGPAKVAVNKQASAIADFDHLRDDDDEEIKYEKITLECARAIQKARLEKEWSQAQLAKAINEKTGLIVDIESGEAPYNPNTITQIEKALGVKVPRGRGGKKKKKPANQF